MRSWRIVIGWVLAVLGSIATVFGFFMQAYETVHTGLTAAQWQLIGISLFFIAVIFLIVKQQQAYTELKDKVQGVPRGIQIHSNPTIRSKTPAEIPTLSVGGRIILEESHSALSDLMDRCSSMTDYHADKVKEPYLGKWLKISGDVVNVEKKEGMSRNRDSICVQCDYPTLGASESVTVHMDFDAGKWESRLADLERGSQITALGKVGRTGDIGEHWINLESCEVIP